MLFINALLPSASLHVQSYCSYFYSCFCSFASSVLDFLSEPVRQAVLSYPCTKCEGKSEQPETAPVEPIVVEKLPASPVLSRVLLVMSDKELGDFLCERLTGDFSVTLLTESEKVFSYCCHEMPDAIIVDETVGGASGEELCFRLKLNRLLNTIPLMLLVASADDEPYIAHVGCGAEKVSPRSINVFRLKADLRALIDHRILRCERVRSCLTVSAPVVSQNGEKKEKAEVPFEERLRECVEKNLETDGYTIIKLCSDMGMSRTSFYNKMKQDTDLAPEDYVFLFKMEKSKALLASGQYKVYEVAEMVGFCNAKYFGKRFKKLYKVSPSEYMRSIT